MAVIMSTVNTYCKEIFSSIPYLSVKDRMVCEYVKLLPKFSIADCDWLHCSNQTNGVRSKNRIHLRLNIPSYPAHR